MFQGKFKYIDYVELRNDMLKLHCCVMPFEMKGYRNPYTDKISLGEQKYYIPKDYLKENVNA